MSNQDQSKSNNSLTPEELKREIESDEVESKKNPELWRKNNEWLEKFIDFLEGVSSNNEEAEKLVKKYVNGEITLATLQGVSQETLLQAAENAYLQFQRGKLQEAEVLFKALVALDHNNPYYYLSLGAIYQRTDRWIDALAYYTVALELDPKNITAYVNRGEINYRFGYREEPLEDFEKAIVLDPKGKDPWANRARFLKDLILKEKEVK